MVTTRRLSLANQLLILVYWRPDFLSISIMKRNSALERNLVQSCFICHSPGGIVFKKVRIFLPDFKCLRTDSGWNIWSIGLDESSWTNKKTINLLLGQIWSVTFLGGSNLAKWRWKYFAYILKTSSTRISAQNLYAGYVNQLKSNAQSLRWD